MSNILSGISNFMDNTKNRLGAQFFGSRAQPTSSLSNMGVTVKNFLEDAKNNLIAQQRARRMMNELPTTDMGMREGQLRSKVEAMLPPKSPYPTTDMGMKRGIERARLMEQARNEGWGISRTERSLIDERLRRGQVIDAGRIVRTPVENMPDWMKPQFRINSLDRQNNDPLRTGSIDSFKGNTDVKPIPSATFSGLVSKIPSLTPQ